MPLLLSTFALPHTMMSPGCMGTHLWGHRLLLPALQQTRRRCFFHPAQTSAELAVLLGEEIHPSSHTARGNAAALG